MMKKTFTIKQFLLTAGLLSGLLLPAQEYFTGHIKYGSGGLDKIYYDRTQETISENVFQSSYKIMDERKQVAYSVTLIHDRLNSTFSLAVKKQGSDPKGSIIGYDRERSGLIYSDKGNLDTSFTVQSFSYLWSFSDTSRDYPVIHIIEMDGGKQLELDPLSKLRIKKHNELVKSIKSLRSNTKIIIEVPKETFSNRLVHLRDSLYSKNVYYIDYIGRLKVEVETAIADAIKHEPLYDGEKRYTGAKKNGHAEGEGLLIDNKNVYDGYFMHGKFIAGKAIVHSGISEYFGGVSNDSLNGLGWLKYKNGSFLLGVFSNGTLSDGISLMKEKNGEVYFGNFRNNKRNGYGELRNGAGDMYYGEFLNGRLTQGYSKEVDQFGYSTYSKIENGTKVSIDPQQAKEFFDITALTHK